MLALLPHGVCYVWDPRLIWLHAGSDSLIAVAYFSIPAVIFLLLKGRSDFPFRATLTWFGLFIAACGLTHVMEVFSVWTPLYWSSGFLKAATAAISVGVAISLWRMRPSLLKVPTPETYRRLNEELDTLVKERTADLSEANARLHAEIQQRREIESRTEKLNEALEHRVNELRTLLDLLPVGIAISAQSEPGAFHYNRAFAELFALGNPNTKSGQNTFHPGHCPGVRSYVAEQELTPEQFPLNAVARDGQSVRDLELRIVLPDGTERNLLISAEPMADSTGRRRGCVGTFQDITRRIREENDFRLVIEAAPNAMIMAGRDGRILLANSEAHRLFQYPPHALKGLLVEALLPEALRQTHQNHRAGFNAHAVRRSMGSGLELFGLRADGEKVALEIGLNPINLSSGPVVLASIIDLSDRKRAEAERLQFERSLHETQKLESLGVLAGGIAHDFNNLLTGILGHSSLIRIAPGQRRPETLDALSHIEHSSERAADLCRQLMAYAGKGRFEHRSLDLSELVRETGKLLDVSVGKVAQLIYRLSPDLPAVIGDPTQIRQVLMNLVINASEAVEPKQGIITVNTTVIDASESYIESLEMSHELKPGRYVTLEVQDNGKGMDDATRRRIFDPFFTTKFTGRGLGLAAVQGIVHGHGGGIRVYSEVKRGTLFKILLPAADKPAESTDKPKANISPTSMQGNILVIDDEAAVRNLARIALSRFGFTVELAESGPVALAMVAAAPHTFDLVMVDLTMPEMDGDMVIHELHRSAPHIPILLMSGFNEQDTIQRIAHRKPNAFLSKPFGIDTLLEKVRFCLGVDQDPKPPPAS